MMAALRASWLRRLLCERGPLLPFMVTVFVDMLLRKGEWKGGGGKERAGRWFVHAVTVVGTDANPNPRMNGKST